MKTSIKSLSRISIALTVAIIYLSGSLVIAQKASGIYITANDFTNNKLSFTRLENKKFKIRLHGISFKLPIKIVCGDSILRLKKDSVYGYRDSEGGKHRFFKDEAYAVVKGDSNIVIYKILISGKSKYGEAFYTYFFSRNDRSPIYLLSLRNIEMIYKENRKFCEFVEIHFKSDNELFEYDHLHTTFKINRLLALSLN